MVTIQHSIEVQVPATRLYIQLTQFEDYPQFLENVEKVEQISKTHLHWTTRTAERPIEWDARVTEQEENRHIVWHNANDGNDSARIEIDELGPNLSRITFALQVAPGQFSGITGSTTEEATARQLKADLTNLKEFLEHSGSFSEMQFNRDREPDVNEIDPLSQANIMNQVRANSQERTPSSMSGSPTEVLEDEPSESGPGMPHSDGESGQTCSTGRTSRT
jgi:hypothetical protein